MISDGNWTEWSTIQGIVGRSAERVELSRFEITSSITPELYDTKSNYQLIVSITKCENVQYRWTSFFTCTQNMGNIFIPVANSGETTFKRIQFSADDWRARSETVRLQLSNYKKLKLDSCNWIPTWPRYNYVANRRAENQSRASILL